MSYIAMNQELCHHGILGMKWGIRRYQNEDGSLTAAGRKRYSKEYSKLAGKAATEIVKNPRFNEDAMRRFEEKQNSDKVLQRYSDRYNRRKMSEDEFAEKFVDRANELLAMSFDEVMLDYTRTNKNAIKAKKLAQKYKMMDWDDLAKQNFADEERVAKNYGKSR